MFFKCDTFNRCPQDWVKTEEGYLLEALIVNAASFKPCTLIVLRKENNQFHDDCFDRLAHQFHKLANNTGFHHEVSTLMMKAYNKTLKLQELKDFHHFDSIKDIILETTKNVYSEIFTDISTFVFHGSALLLWLITYEIVTLSLGSQYEQTLQDIENCASQLRMKQQEDASFLKRLTRVRRKLFQGQCTRTNGSSMYWFKSDKNWLLQLFSIPGEEGQLFSIPGKEGQLFATAGWGVSTRV
jgi:hypothetical protein